MSAIYRKELRCFFTNLTGPIFIAFLLLFTGIFSVLNCFKGLSPFFEDTLGMISFIFLLTVPLLTMRTFAEERHQRTDQLLYALPLSAWQIVLGKYLAMLTVLLLPVLVMCLVPWVLSMYGTVYLASAYASIFAFFLLGAVLLAMGMLISSMTESQVVAAIITIAVSLVCYLMGMLSALLPTTSIASFFAFLALVLILSGIAYLMTRSATLAYALAIGGVLLTLILYLVNPSMFVGSFAKCMNWLSLYERFTIFTTGLFDLTAIFYDFSLIFLFVFLSVQSLEKRRWS